MRNATNMRTFCFKDRHYESFCFSTLWPFKRLFVLCHSIITSWYFRSLDLCILFKSIFLYLRYIPPHSCAFHTFCSHQFFHMYILPCGISFTSPMMPLIVESSEFNYILLFKVYSFEYP